MFLFERCHMIFSSWAGAMLKAFTLRFNACHFSVCNKPIPIWKWSLRWTDTIFPRRDFLLQKPSKNKQSGRIFTSVWIVCSLFRCGLNQQWNTVQLWSFHSIPVGDFEEDNAEIRVLPLQKYPFDIFLKGQRAVLYIALSLIFKIDFLLFTKTWYKNSDTVKARL